jgi:hypothetical protein
MTNTPPTDMKLADVPLSCSQGGVPYNNFHIEYWKRRALEAEARTATAPNFGFEMQSTKAMRARIVELSRAGDDYDHAVICVINDLETILAALASAKDTQ